MKQHRSSVMRVLAALAVGTLLLSGCGPGQASNQASNTAGSSSGTTNSTSPDLTPPVLASNAKGTIAQSQALKVTAAKGSLTSVVVTMVSPAAAQSAGSATGASPSGSPEVTPSSTAAPAEAPTGVRNLQGTLSAGNTIWISSAVRAPGQTYRLVATAVSAAGVTASLTKTFRTPAPAGTFSVDVTPWGDQQVGVGQPILVTVSRPVTDSTARAELERGLVVATSKKVGTAAWHWTSATTLEFRPKVFWPANTKVVVHARLAGVKLSQGVWGTTDRDVTFSFGRSFIMKISNAKHMMTVTRNGKTLRSVPVSMGRTGYETRSGIKTIMSHEYKVHMTSASYGGKDFYDEIVYYAQRLTYSGEFVHSAPWSVYAQGHSNVSHGCTNVSPANAIWLYNQTLIGDPVVTTGTNRTMEPGNGYGGGWNLTWKQWLAGSSAGEVTVLVEDLGGGQTKTTSAANSASPSASTSPGTAGATTPYSATPTSAPSTGA